MKDNVKRMRRQATDWNKIFPDTSDKGLLSKIYKELLTLNNKEINNTILKWVKVLNLTKEDALLHVIRGMQNKNNNKIPLYTY